MEAAYRFWSDSASYFARKVQRPSSFALGQYLAYTNSIELSSCDSADVAPICLVVALAAWQVLSFLVSCSVSVRKSCNVNHFVLSEGTK
jgi:hypothetical protein